MLKKALPLVVLASLVTVNLAIQLARFASYTQFMKGLRMNVTVTKVKNAATSTILNLKFTVHSAERNATAYVSSMQMDLKNGNENLGYFPIVGFQNMLAPFENGVFHLEKTMVIPKRITKISTLSYLIYAEVHFVVGSHDLRSVPMFKGKAEMEVKK